MTSRVWSRSSSWSSLETSILATQRKLGRLIIDETPGLRPCTGCWTRQNTPRPLRGPLQRTCRPRTARGAALESLAAPLAPKKMCGGARALRARSAALSKVIVRTEQNNFAGGGAVAGLVLRAPVEQMLWAPKTHHDILYRMLRTRQKAAPRRSPESWGAQNVPRNRAGKCRDAAGARTVCAAAGARWEARRQHSQPAAVSITLCTALPACGREHPPVYSTPGVRP